MRELVAAALALDPRVVEATRLLLEAVQSHQKRLVGPMPADPDRRIVYEDALKRLADGRGSSLFYPYLGSGAGHGALVELADGSVKYDFITGIGVHYFGHGHPELIRAGIEAALGNTLMQGNLQQNVNTLDLVDLLLRGVKRGGSRLEHVFLTSSGAMANENALKMLFQKRAPACRVLAFEGCFMGRTLALSQITDKAAYREGLPSLLAVDYVPFFDPEDPTGSQARAVAALKRHLDRHPGQHASMCFELVQGEGGFHVGEAGFFRALMEVCREQGILVMVDEIQTFGRTPELFAYQYFGLDEFPDVVTIGKLSQVCATFFTDAMKPKPGLVSQTFTASTAAILTGRWIVGTLLKGDSKGDNQDDFFGPKGRVMRLHTRFAAGLKRLEEKHPDKVRGPFGLGAMVAFTAFGGDGEKATAFVKRLFNNGVIAFTAGSKPVRVRFLMPVGAVEEEDIDRVLGIVEKTIEEIG